MVQFCPKCGTPAPDNESVFCNRCGARLPPVIEEKKEITCPRCGTRMTDKEATFCNRCGSPLRIHSAHVQRAHAPPAPAAPPVININRCPSCSAPFVDGISDFCNRCGSPLQTPSAQGQQARAPPAPAALPVMNSHRCHSCGAPYVDGISDFCNKCGASFRAPEPVITVPEKIRVDPPREKKPATVPLIADSPDTGTGSPVKKRDLRPLLKPALIAIAVIIGVVIIAAFMSGVLTSGTNQSSATTPTPTTNLENTKTALPTQKTTRTTTTVSSPDPTEVPTAVPATVGTTSAGLNASVNDTLNASVNGTAKVTPTATKPLSNIDASKTFSIGESAMDGKGKLTVNDYSLKDKLKDPTPSNAIGKKYLILNITYENLQQNATTEVDLRGMTIEDAGSFAFDQVTDDPMLENPFYLNGKTVPPLENRTGNMAFIISPDATFLKFKYNFGDGKIATFQFPQYL